MLDFIYNCFMIVMSFFVDQFSDIFLFSLVAMAVLTFIRIFREV